MDRSEFARRLVKLASSLDAQGLHAQATKVDSTLRSLLDSNIRTAKKDGLDRTLISEKDCGDYVLKKEFVHNGIPEEGVELESAYTKKGDYIGEKDDAKHIVEKKGIQPELSDPEHSVCSIGFAKKDKKWWGWSHRAMKGFGIGDHGYIAVPWDEDDHEEKTKGPKIKTIEEAKAAAKAFAESVS